MPDPIPMHPPEVVQRGRVALRLGAPLADSVKRLRRRTTWVYVLCLCTFASACLVWLGLPSWLMGVVLCTLSLAGLEIGQSLDRSIDRLDVLEVSTRDIRVD